MAAAAAGTGTVTRPTAAAKPPGALQPRLRPCLPTPSRSGKAATTERRPRPPGRTDAGSGGAAEERDTCNK